MKLTEKLDLVQEKYDELAKKIIDPDIMNDREKWQKLLIEHGELEELMNAYIEYKKLNEELKNSKEMLYEKLDEDMLFIKEIRIDEGPRLKRLWCRGRGRADVQLKRMCHITVIVDEKAGA